VLIIFEMHAPWESYRQVGDGDTNSPELARNRIPPSMLSGAETLKVNDFTIIV